MTKLNKWWCIIWTKIRPWTKQSKIRYKNWKIPKKKLQKHRCGACKGFKLLFCSPWIPELELIIIVISYLNQ